MRTITVKTPFRKWIDAQKPGAKSPMTVIREAFLANGWNISTGLLSMWNTGERTPNLRSQLRLKVVCGEECGPAAWAEYHEALEAQAAPKKKARTRASA